MVRVAELAGVRAPSLYKHVEGRGDLIRLIIGSVLSELAVTMDSAVAGDDARADLTAIAHAFRDFARAQPESYRIVFAPVPEEWRPDPDTFTSAVEPLLRTISALSGPDHALEGSRLVAAWAHGFLTMELAGAFRMGGDIDAAYDFGIERLAESLAASSGTSSSLGR